MCKDGGYLLPKMAKRSQLCVDIVIPRDGCKRQTWRSLGMNCTLTTLKQPQDVVWCLGSFLSAYFTYNYVYLCWEVGGRSYYECRYPNEIEEVSRCPGAGVTGSHELLDKGSGKRTRFFCKSSTLPVTEPLSFLLSTGVVL